MLLEENYTIKTVGSNTFLVIPASYNLLSKEVLQLIRSKQDCPVTYYQLSVAFIASDKYNIPLYSPNIVNGAYLYSCHAHNPKHFSFYLIKKLCPTSATIISSPRKLCNNLSYLLNRKAFYTHITKHPKPSIPTCLDRLPLKEVLSYLTPREQELYLLLIRTYNPCTVTNNIIVYP